MEGEWKEGGQMLIVTNIGYINNMYWPHILHWLIPFCPEGVVYNQMDHKAILY